MKRKRYISVFQEEVTLADLKSDAGMSSFTADFKSERNDIMGSETKRTSLSDCIIHEDTGDVDFVFISEATDKYPDDYKYQKTPQYRNFNFIPNPEETYEVVIRIKNVLDWLKTYPEKKEITDKDIKDILDVSNIEISSSNPSWYWQGMAWNLQQLDGTIEKKAIKKPQHWNKPHLHGDGNAFLDKIAQGVINQTPFFRNLMASRLTKKLKKKGLI